VQALRRQNPALKLTRDRKWKLKLGEVDHRLLRLLWGKGEGGGKAKASAFE